MLLALLALSGCGERPPDPILGTWEYDVDASAKQRERRPGDSMLRTDSGVVWESPLVFGPTGEYWEGDVPRPGASPPPVGRWRRGRRERSYEVVFTDRHRARRVMTLAIVGQSLIETHESAAARSVYYRRPIPSDPMPW